MTKKRNLSQVLGLLLFLIILPAGSWYYLQKGFDYQEKIHAELKGDYGTIPSSIDFMSLQGQRNTFGDFRGKLSLLAFVDKTNWSASLATTWRKLYDQFTDTQKAVFIMANLDDDLNLSRQTILPNGQDCFYLDSNNSSLFLKHLEQPNIGAGRQADGKYRTSPIQSQNAFPYFVLVDTSAVIRNYYPLNDTIQIKRMVEHLALIMPREASKKPVLIREKEK